MLTTKVKASSITNLTDARYFAAWGVHWLGFNLDSKSDTYIQPQVMKAIKEWVDGVQIVGEFDLQSAEEIQTAIEMMELDLIQVGTLTELSTLIEISTSIAVIKEIVVDTQSTFTSIEDTLDQFSAHAKYFILNLDKNGISWQQLENTKNPFSLEDLNKWCTRYPIILSIDLDSELVDEIMKTIPVYGINVKGGEEEKTGYKSFDELDEVFETLEVLE